MAEDDVELHELSAAYPLEAAKISSACLIFPATSPLANIMEFLMSEFERRRFLQSLGAAVTVQIGAAAAEETGEMGNKNIPLPPPAAGGSRYEARTPDQVTADLQAPRLNSDGGLSLYSTKTSIEWANGIMGGSWRVASRRESFSSSTYPGARATEAVLRVVTGNSNGPSRSDCASFRSVVKADYLSSTKDGEINVDFLAVGQGLHGDCSSVLSEVNKVAGGTGGAVAHESSVKMRDASGAVVRTVQAIKNFQEGIGGVSGGKGFGWWCEARDGDPYSAFHADQSQSSTGAAWQNYQTFTKDRSVASIIYKVDGAGRVHASHGSPISPGYAFVGDSDTGMYSVSKDALGFSTGGVMRVYVAANGSIVPGADNVYSMGAASTGRFANAYLANAPTVGSDKRLKTDIIDSPLGLDFILAQRPVAYRLKEGGRGIEWVDEEEWVDVPVTEEADTWIDDSYVIAGKKVENYRKERGQVPVYDHVPELDEQGIPTFDDISEPLTADDGVPVMELLEQVPITYRDPDGKLQTLAQPAVLQQKFTTRRRYRMKAVARTHKVKKIIQRPVEKVIAGQRQHFGLLAQEVKESLPKNVDFGGWVKEDVNDPNSLEMLRYEQFIAPLIKAVQELEGRNRELERRLALLERKNTEHE